VKTLIMLMSFLEQVCEQ